MGKYPPGYEPMQPTDPTPVLLRKLSDLAIYRIEQAAQQQNPALAQGVTLMLQKGLDILLPEMERQAAALEDAAARDDLLEWTARLRLAMQALLQAAADLPILDETAQ